jgi:hypothetical protein
MDAEESRGTEPTTIQLQSFPNNQARVIGKATQTNSTSAQIYSHKILNTSRHTCLR